MISTTASYAMKALTLLAVMPSGCALRGRDLAARAHVPASYLAKILLVLNRAGLVEATRGTGGGYRLDRPPAEIHLLDIVELFDPPAIFTDCLLAHGHACSEEAPCLAHAGWSKVRETYMSFLKTTTLKQISAAT